MSSQKTILLLDDDKDLQELIRITLKSKGYHVVIAENGEEGLEQLKTLRPDLIILDVNMPKMGGVAFYRQIYHKGQALYPVLVLTARANMESMFRDFEVDGFINKPFEIDELLTEVGAIIKKREAAAVALAAFQKMEPLKVCIEDNDKQVFSSLREFFLNAGYVVVPIHDVSEAIDVISATMPNAVLVNLELFDVAWDIVVAKLKTAVESQNVRFVLYAKQTAEKAAEQMKTAENMQQKAEIDCCVVYENAQKLVDSVNKLLSI